MTSVSRCASRVGGDSANGRFMFDAEGYLWCGMNWMPGSQSGVNKSTGGGVGKYAPNGAALSSAIFGFTVIYGVAAPVKAPRIGKVRQP